MSELQEQPTPKKRTKISQAQWEQAQRRISQLEQELVGARQQLVEAHAVGEVLADDLAKRCAQLRELEVHGLAALRRRQVKAAIAQQQAQANPLGPRA